jgi:hypothetical protein
MYSLRIKENQLEKQKKSWLFFSLALLAIIFAGVIFWMYEKNNFFGKTEQIVQENQPANPKSPEIPEKISRPIPSSVSMQRMKTQGCVADGLLSAYNPENDDFTALINRSNCYYLHRAIETWLTPPDFSAINYYMNQITKKDVVYGMFIAEAIDTKAEYYNVETATKFDFEKMCRTGSMNAWGQDTCKPTFASKEYRDYIQYITHKAIDLGVQSFTFGQIYMQEGAKKSYAPKIVADIRSYAKEKGVDVVIGAQTGNITDPKYLKLFDYIEGGVGIDENGNVQDGPCLAGKGGCWALLWNKTFSDSANNVLLALDWSGIISDDLDIFARMDAGKRQQTLANLYQKFTSQNMGFMMPFFGVLSNDNAGCRGPKKKFYSPDNKYDCKDENAINKILSK